MAAADTETTRLSMPTPIEEGRGTRRVKTVFRWIFRLIVLSGLLSCCYWLFSSDRYVSEAIIIVQNTEQIGTPTIDLPTILGGVGGIAKPDQLLLREHLLSVDMLKKLDAAFDLRGHYSSSKNDFASRMWFRDCPIEWFHRYYLSRVSVTLDDYSGVLRISAQAYDATMAQAIATMLVNEGEHFLNEMSHDLARAQAAFLDKEVADAYDQVLKASDVLLDFQNKKGLSSPKATAESYTAIIGKLEAQRTELQTQLAALPRNLDRQHPTRKALQQSLQAVERQIAQENAKLASTLGTPLNSLLKEEQRLNLELEFKQALYKTSLAALEKGRMDAARTLKKASVLQKAGKPEYAVQPERIYGVVTTICMTLLLLGISNLLRSIILDHVD